MLCNDTSSIPCELGSVLYENGKCYLPSSAPEGLMSVGVVFNTAQRLAVFKSSHGSLKLSTGTGCSTLSTEFCNNTSLVNSCGTNSEKNSTALRNITCTIYPHYLLLLRNTPSCSGNNCKLGVFLLPSAKDIQTLFQNRTAVTVGLRSISTESSPLSSGTYWTSTYASSDKVWTYNTETGAYTISAKNAGFYYYRLIVKY